MALQKTVTFAGVTVTDAYHKISRVHGGKDRGFTLHIDIYADKATADSDGQTIDSMGIDVDYSDSLGTLSSLYTHLKNNVAEYSGATDA
jgi:hypothetical protein